MNRTRDAQDGNEMRSHARTWFEASASGDPDESALWYRSRAALRFVFARFVPLLAAGNLVWEIFHLPYYTLWQEGTPRSRLFAILHCTAGDVMIGTASVLVAITLFGRRDWPHRGHGAVLGATAAAGVAYTLFSEWLNTEVTMGWQYAESMMRLPPLGTGIAPLLQWIVVPPLAYWFAHEGATAATLRKDR